MPPTVHEEDWTHLAEIHADISLMRDGDAWRCATIVVYTDDEGNEMDTATLEHIDPADAMAAIADLVGQARQRAEKDIVMKTITMDLRVTPEESK